MSVSSPLVLGLDLSTQSLSAVVLDPETGRVFAELSLSYRDDPRLRGFGFEYDSLLIPSRTPGEADQPPLLFLAALDALFADLKLTGLDLSRIAVVNTSAQQHGHVYLSQAGIEAIALLADSKKLAALGDAKPDLVSLFRSRGAFSYGASPIWKTSNTVAEADDLRKAAGGSEKMLRLSGSDSPLRFTGAVVRRVGKQFPQAYAATKKVLLLSTFFQALLSGNSKAPSDFGNASGMSLMDYQARDWSRVLTDAAGDGLPGGAEALRAKLPALASPLEVVGELSAYFCERYGFSPSCKVLAGSGDNPQTKVLFDGDLLSLGTSFVLMAGGAGSADQARAPQNPDFNGMYDGLGRPFAFACRTNGALVLDRLAGLYGKRGAYADFEQALAVNGPEKTLRLWQPDAESFPFSSAFELKRLDSAPVDFAHDYAALVDSTLGLLRAFSISDAEVSSAETDKRPLYLSGGPTANPQIVRRVAALWQRPVVVIGKSGAALGAAAAASRVYFEQGSAGGNQAGRFAELCARLIEGKAEQKPDAVLEKAFYEGSSAYLPKLKAAFESIVAKK